MSGQQRGKRGLTVVLAPIGLGVLAFFVTGAATATLARLDTPQKLEIKPFAVGEFLTYRVEWSPPWYLFFLPTMDAGEATLGLAEGAPNRGRRAFMITFTAKSSGTLVKLTGMSIDDRFEFSSDAETFCTYSVNKRVREGKRMRDIDYSYSADTGKLHLREIDVALQPPQVLRDRDYEKIPPCVKDLFSALYALRLSQLEAGNSVRVLVGNDQDVREVEVVFEKKDKVSTPAGSFDAWQVNTISVIGGLFKGGGEFRMWLSADRRKMPVKFEAKVYIGKVVGSLKTAKS